MGWFAVRSRAQTWILNMAGNSIDGCTVGILAKLQNERERERERER
jgi:hypothetical protein